MCDELPRKFAGGDIRQLDAFDVFHDDIGDRVAGFESGIDEFDDVWMIDASDTSCFAFESGEDLFVAEVCRR